MRYDRYLKYNFPWRDKNKESMAKVVINPTKNQLLGNRMASGLKYTHSHVVLLLNVKKTTFTLVSSSSFPLPPEAVVLDRKLSQLTQLN
jgi:hypothetical protein